MQANQHSIWKEKGRYMSAIKTAPGFLQDDYLVVLLPRLLPIYLLPALYDNKHVVCVYIYTLGPKSTKK